MSTDSSSEPTLAPVPATSEAPERPQREARQFNRGPRRDGPGGPRRDGGRRDSRDRQLAQSKVYDVWKGKRIVHVEVNGAENPSIRILCSIHSVHYGTVRNS
mgnify:CR=1 FL=1